MKIEKVRLNKYEGPDGDAITVGNVYEVTWNIDEDDYEYVILDDDHCQHVISPDWCTVIQDEFGVRDIKQQPQEWSGEGLPPVGTVCEFRRNPDEWIQGVIFGHRKNRNGTIEVFVDFEIQSNWDYSSDLSRFRPIKSEEDKEIEEMLSNIHQDFSEESLEQTHPREYVENACLQLYNAGYRKTK